MYTSLLIGACVGIFWGIKKKNLKHVRHHESDSKLSSEMLLEESLASACSPPLKSLQTYKRPFCVDVWKHENVWADRVDSPPVLMKTCPELSLDQIISPRDVFHVRLLYFLFFFLLFLRKT